MLSWEVWAGVKAAEGGDAGGEAARGSGFGGGSFERVRGRR